MRRAFVISAALLAFAAPACAATLGERTLEKGDGNRTACGYTLGHRTRGIAHRTLPCGTPVPVYYGGRLAIFPVIDRGPHSAGCHSTSPLRLPASSG